MEHAAQLRCGWICFGQQERAYKAMVQAAMVELEGGTLMANGVLAEMIRMKQFANSYGFMGGKMNSFLAFLVISLTDCRFSC